MFYTIPDTLSAEISELENKIRLFKSGQLDGGAFKAHRVPFGVYEQRADNTFMARIRCPGGALTPRQLRKIAEVSIRYGADHIHVTTRQEFQIHDLNLDDVIRVMRELLTEGLSTRGGGGNTVRNIIGSADSGVAPGEVLDTQPFVSALTSRLVAESDSWLLPRKYKIAFANSPADNSRAMFNDLGFIAKIEDGVQGFEVYVAGGMGGKPQTGHRLHEFVPGADVYLVAAAIKRLFNKNGNRKNRHAARLRFLWNTLGEEKFKELYNEELRILRAENPPPLKPFPLNFALSAPGIAAVETDSPEFLKWRERYVAPQRQAGLNQALIPIFLGNLDNRKAIGLADFLSRFGDDTLRGTIDQNLLLRNIPDEYLGNVFVLANQISDLASAPRFLASAVACTGASTCKLGICLPRGALSAAAKKLKASGLDLDRIAGLKFNISGCPNTCGAHMAADLGFYGKVLRKGQTPYPAYGIVVGGKAGAGVAALAEPAGDVAARDLPAFVVDFLGRYIDRKAAYPDFSRYLEAEGKARISEWTQAHKEIPDFDDDKNYYYDWSAPEVFSLAGRGVGECSAGLFDLIESDLKRIRRFREELPGLSGQERAQALYQITLSAARMLLITRAVEPKSDADVFSQFHKYFLGSGLVEPKFTALIELGQRSDVSAISSRENEVLSLAQAVGALYEKMDNSLRFPQETSAPAQPSNPAPALAEIAQRDFRGVACPMNFVKTKVALEPLKPGDRLAVLLDDGAPIQNVPRSVASEGHKIVSQTREAQHWRVVIEKVG